MSFHAIEIVDLPQPAGSLDFTGRLYPPTFCKCFYIELNHMLTMFFFSVERMKKVNANIKNPHRVGANFDRKKETSDDW